MGFFKDFYKKINIKVPEYHFVLGSGFSESLQKVILSPEFSEWQEQGSCSFDEVPHLKKATVSGHDGMYRYFVHKKTDRSICFQSGRLHGYEGYTPQDVCQTVKLPCLDGTKNFIITNISGSLKKNLPPGSVVNVSDHINFTGKNPLVGPNPKDSSGQELGARFPDMKGAYNISLRKKVSQSLKSQDIRVEEGKYIGVLGPSLETPAEIDLFASWNLDVVGMSTIWEVIALHHMQACVSVFSLVSNFACGVSKEDLVADDFSKVVSSYSFKMIQAFFNFSVDQFTKGSDV